MLTEREISDILDKRLIRICREISIVEWDVDSVEIKSLGSSLAVWCYSHQYRVNDQGIKDCPEDTFRLSGMLNITVYTHEFRGRQQVIANYEHTNLTKEENTSFGFPDKLYLRIPENVKYINNTLRVENAKLRDQLSKEIAKSQERRKGVLYNFKSLLSEYKAKHGKTLAYAIGGFVLTCIIVGLVACGLMYMCSKPRSRETIAPSVPVREYVDDKQANKNMNTSRDQQGRVIKFYDDPPYYTD